jgi:PAS domain S-box-containing protein
MKRPVGDQEKPPGEARTASEAAFDNPSAPFARPAETGGRSDVANFELTVTDILEALPFYVMLVDEHHHILQANGAVRAHLGIEPENIIGGYCPKVIHGLDETWYACPLEEAVERGGEPIEREAFDEKSRRWVRSAVYPLSSRSEDGGRIYFHTVSDITDR